MSEEKKFSLTKFRRNLIEKIENDGKNKNNLNEFFTWSQTISDFTNKRHVFYQEFKPFWVTLKILGMLPYCVDENGDVVTNFLSKEMIYCVVAYTLTSIPIYYILYLRACIIFNNRDNFDSMIFSITMFCLTIPHLVIPVSHWATIRIFQTACKAWKEFQAQYESVTGNPLVFNSCWKVFVILPSVMIYIFIVVCVHVFSLESQHYGEALAHVYVVTFFFLHSIIFIGQCYVVVCLCKNIKTKLRKIIEEERDEEIPQWIHLWLNLSKLTEYIGALFYKMYAHLLLMAFIVTTLAMYCVLRAFFAGHFSTLIVNALICLNLGQLWLYIICECGERVAREVGRNFIREMGGLKFLTKNPSVKCQISDFVNTISQFPPSVSLNGYFCINRRLLLSICSTGATYLFVVLQFSQNSSPKHFGVNNSSHCP